MSEYERYLRAYPEIMRQCKAMLADVYAQHSPQAYPRMLHWLDKEHGSGRIDLYQNCLIIALCNSDFVAPTEEIEPPKIYMYSTKLYRCKQTGQIWLRTTYEIRMLAFQERFERYGEILTAAEIGAAVSDRTGFSADFFATVGFEPAQQNRLPLTDWREYLLEVRK